MTVQNKFERGSDGRVHIKTTARGRDLLSNPMLNRGTGFTHQQRRELGLEGLLPYHVSTPEEQVQRAWGNISRKDDDLEKYIGMCALQDRDETLFYRVLLEHLEALMPTVYTPTVGEACSSFSSIYRRGRGLWLTPKDSGRLDEVLANLGNDDIRLIVVTDGERILGLGDQGAGGMGIPVGKLALYSVCAGIHPSQALPICLDVGTDNKHLLDDPLYIGWRKPRLRGEKYDAFVEEFVNAVRKRFPEILLQWEDFKKANAIALLERYQDKICSFNDDIQGTAAVGLCAVLTTAKATGTKLTDQRVVILGAGAAGVGIGHQIRNAMSRAGLSDSKLTAAVAVLDSGGLLVENRAISHPYKREFAWPVELAQAQGISTEGRVDLLAVVQALKPTILIGTSGQAGAFTQPVIEAMAKGCERPGIFPFSNPTSKAEAVPTDILTWSSGRALVATGSPFDPVTINGRTISIPQSNNVYIFPGVGLGVLVAQARQVTDTMFTIAAEVVANAVTKKQLQDGILFPSLTELRTLSKKIAVAVVKECNSKGLGSEVPVAEIESRVESMMWYPDYPVLEPV